MVVRDIANLIDEPIGTKDDIELKTHFQSDMEDLVDFL